MNFLTEDDFGVQIRTEVLSVLTVSTTSLDIAENMAQEQITSYISTRYDAAATFSATGVDRNPLIIMYMIDLLLYHLHSNTAGRVIPKHREDRYAAAIDWLTKVNSGDLIPTLTAIAATTPDPIFRFGSDWKYSNRW